MSGGSSRIAVIDIGTNSTRLLVAEVAGGRVQELERQTRVTRLGRGVDLSGNLASEGMEAVCETVAEYIAIYERVGVDSVEAIATSAVRDAGNGAAFIAELRERFDLAARVLDGDQEALLTYRGATSGEAPEGRVLVIDIGGGSTELIVGRGSTVEFRASLQAGVVRQSERHLAADPPTSAEMERLAGEIRGLLSESLADEVPGSVDSAIAVAGTPTSLAAIELGLEPYDREQVHRHVLSLAAIQRMLSQLASLPLEERRRVPGLHPDRAPMIVAGVLILIEVMRVFDVSAVTASEHDLLYGTAIEAAQGRNPK